MICIRKIQCQLKDLPTSALYGNFYISDGSLLLTCPPLSFMSRTARLFVSPMEMTWVLLSWCMRSAHTFLSARSASWAALQEKTFHHHDHHYHFPKMSPQRNSSLHESPWVFMSLHESSWVSMSLHESSWVSMSLHESPWVSMNLHESPWVLWVSVSLIINLNKWFA